MKILRLLSMLLVLCAVTGCDRNADTKYVFAPEDILSWEEGRVDLVIVTLKPDVAVKFNDFTAKHIGQTVNLYLGDILFSSPQLREPSTTDSIYLAGFKGKELEDLKASLPADKKSR